MFKKIMPLACMAMLLGAALTQQAAAQQANSSAHNAQCDASCDTKHPVCRDSLVPCTTKWVRSDLTRSQSCYVVNDVDGRFYNRTRTKSWCERKYVKKQIKCVRDRDVGNNGRRTRTLRDRFGRPYQITEYKHKRITVDANNGRTYKQKCDIKSHRRGSGGPTGGKTGGGMYTIDESLQSIGAPLPQQPIIQLVP